MANERTLPSNEPVVTVVARSVVVVVLGEVVVVVVGSAAARIAAAVRAGVHPGVGTVLSTGRSSGADGRPNSCVEMALAMIVAPATLGWRWSGLKYGAKGVFGLHPPL